VATERAKVDATLTRFLRSVIYVALLVMVALAAAQQVNVPIASFFAILGAAGLAIGLALKDSLANFSSGVMLVFFRPFKAGDFVDAGGVSGTVTEISIFNTIMKTPDNRIITVPNGQIYAGSITNYSAESTRRIDLVFGIGYDDDIEAAQQVLEEVVAAHELILKDPAPVVRVSELADSSVNFVCRPWTKTADYWTVYWDLTREVKQAFDKAGISIPFPQRDVHVYGAAAPAAPASAATAGAHPAPVRTSAPQDLPDSDPRDDV
jgi:small conductance mechanosensitive channel